MPIARDTEVFAPLMREDSKVRTPLRRILLALLGGLCLAAGVIGWLVPVVTGLPFYVAGMVCLGKASPWFAHQINRVEARLPVRLRRLLRWRPGRGRRAASGRVPESAGMPRGRDGGATPASRDAENQDSQIRE